MGQAEELVSRIAGMWAAGTEPAAGDVTKN